MRQRPPPFKVPVLVQAQVEVRDSGTPGSFIMEVGSVEVGSAEAAAAGGASGSGRPRDEQLGGSTAAGSIQEPFAPLLRKPTFSHGGSQAVGLGVRRRGLVAMGSAAAAASTSTSSGMRE